MDKRTNNRQRPASDAADRRRPPQHHPHQPNNASWGDLDEENQKLCHIIKKKKDQIKRLEELLEVRTKGFSEETKKYAEKVSKLETENYQLTVALKRQEKESKQRFDEMVARYEAERQTASNQIKEVLRQEVKSQVRSEYQGKVAQIEKRIDQMSKEQHSLHRTLSEAKKALSSKDAALQQSDEAWQAKYDALKEKLTLDLEENNKSWEAQQNEVNIKVSLIEEQVLQRDAEILHLTKDNNSLIEKLSEKTEEISRKDDELLQSQRAWEDKCNTLETNITEELAEKHQAEVKQLMDEKVELEDLCLYVNKRRRRFLLFPRRSSDDRETQLQKMKNKMQQKAAKARGAEKMEEEMEAADCSAQAGHQ
ncbi:hypothetical protein ABVT39_007996 [Epinephelus coioides]